MTGSAQHAVLVIDDDAHVGKSVARSLQPHDVVVVRGARAGLELLANGHHFDVIVCDLMMPGLTGRDFFERVTSEFPEYCARVIFLTGGPTTKETEDFVATTTRPIVLKPFVAHELRDWVAKTIAAHTESSSSAAG